MTLKYWLRCWHSALLLDIIINNMKQTVSEHDFRNAFMAFEDRKDTFSYYGLTALYEYMLEQEDASDGDFEFELDVIAICCEWSEYATALEAVEDRGHEIENDNGRDAGDIETEAFEWLQEQTQVIEFNENNPFMKSRTSGVIINTSF